MTALAPFTAGFIDFASFKPYCSKDKELKGDENLAHILLLHRPTIYLVSPLGGLRRMTDWEFSDSK